MATSSGPGAGSWDSPTRPDNSPLTAKGRVVGILTGDGPKEAVSDVKTTQEIAPAQARPRASRPRTVQSCGTQYTHVKEWSAQL